MTAISLVCYISCHCIDIFADAIEPYDILMRYAPLLISPREAMYYYAGWPQAACWRRHTRR